jgi:antitoxin PrlF
MEATVAERGQITLPKAVRDALGLTKGTKLKVEVEGGRIVLRKNVDDAISRIRGLIPLPPGVSTDDIMRELRGRAPGDPIPEWDMPAAAGAAPKAVAARAPANAGATPRRRKPAGR